MKRETAAEISGKKLKRRDKLGPSGKSLRRTSTSLTGVDMELLTEIGLSDVLQAIYRSGPND
jgi:hypothetical protein